MSFDNIIMKHFKYIFTFSLLLTLLSCESGSPFHIPSDDFCKTFENDSRNEFQSFIPSKDELFKLEIELKRHLEHLTKSDSGLVRNVLNEVHPLEYSLGWFNRRYFGRISTDGERKIFVELVFVRCAGKEKWKRIDYLSELDSICWWSIEYDVAKNKIEIINYP